jgi:hypothetical protein
MQSESWIPSRMTTLLKALRSKATFIIRWSILCTNLYRNIFLNTKSKGFLNLFCNRIKLSGMSIERKNMKLSQQWSRLHLWRWSSGHPLFVLLAWARNRCSRGVQCISQNFLWHACCVASGESARENIFGLKKYLAMIILVR